MPRAVRNAPSAGPIPLLLPCLMPPCAPALEAGEAASEGHPASGVLRFLLVNGELSPRPLEEIRTSGRFARPVYDLDAGRALAR